MNRIMKTAATGVLALSLAAVGTGSALADDITPPTEEASSPSTVVADATPDTAAPVTTETSPSSETSTVASSDGATTPTSTTSASPGPEAVSDAGPAQPSIAPSVDPASISERAGETLELHWLTTNKTEPTADTVNWPQSKVDPTACGTGWVQNDKVKYGTKHERAIVDAFGDTLEKGEDSSVIISWTFTKQTPCAVPAEQCIATGGTYTESDDRAPVLTPAGYSFVSKGDRVPVEIGYPLSGNLQGINNISYTTTDTVGYGIFFRFVVDLTGDGLGGYNSLSITTPTITQASVADVGSKNVFLGKTIAEIAALYPHNKITSGHWQTGSSYPAGDGATLTGASGDCGNVNYATVQPEPTTRTTVVTDDAVCAANEDGTFPGGGTITTTTTVFTTPFVWNPETASYVPGAEVAGEPVVTTADATLEECPATVVVVTPTDPTPSASPSPSTSPAPIVKASSETTLPFTGLKGGALVGTVIAAFLLLLIGAGIAVATAARRRNQS